MKLFDFAFSPNCRKVRAVAYELDVPFESVHVDLLRGEQRGAEFLRINPNGRVPALVDGDFVLFESTAIIRYFSALRDGALVPRSPRQRADVDRWLAWQLAHLGPAMSKVAFERVVKPLTGQGKPDEAAVAQGAAEFTKLTALLDAALGEREYLAGSLSVADFALAAHFSLAQACGLDLEPHARVRAWLERMLSRKSMQQALADASAVSSPHAAA